MLEAKLFAEDAQWSTARSLDALDLHMFHRAYGSQAKDQDKLCASYITHIGFRRHHILKIIRQRMLDELGGDALDTWGRLSPDRIPMSFGPFSSIYNTNVVEHSSLTHGLSEDEDNEFFSKEFPEKLRFCLARERRHGLSLYGAEKCTLYCDVGNYQVYDVASDSMWATAGPFALSKSIRTAKVQRFSGREIIYVGDIFGGSNFSHFLFDYVTRIGRVLDASIFDSRSLIFVASGIPGKFHSLVLSGLVKAYGLQPDQFFFPTEPTNVVTDRSVHWFSDSHERNQHPAQLMDKRSTSVIRRVSDEFTEPDGPFRKIYISRADAKQRRISNEGEIVGSLSERGFHTIVMSEMPISQQISMIRGADVIVAPHGMGLTLCAFHRRSPKIIELFSPSIGTDAYAAMSMALKFDYSYVVGEEVHGSADFSVPVGSLEEKL